MIKFLMAITSAVKLDMDFVILSKLRSTFEKLSLVDLLHSISISNSLTFTDYLAESLLALSLITKIILFTMSFSIPPV